MSAAKTTMSETTIRSWIDAELQRTAGQNLTDFDDETQQQLLDSFEHTHDIRKRVREWRRI